MLLPLALALAQTGPQPVVMAERQLGPPTEITGGTTAPVTVEGASATLFVPNGWKAEATTTLWCHFHSAPWYVVSEYQRAGCKDPVLVFNLGQGSTVYAKPFLESGSFGKWVTAAESALGSPQNPATVRRLNFTSFSAGYGAVRAIIDDPHVLRILHTVILNDSFYGGLKPGQGPRVPDPKDVEVWRPLVDRAASGSTTLIVTTSQITPETYAGTWEVAQALVESIGGKMDPAEKGSSPAANGSPQTLLRQFSKGRFFVWSYDGSDATAHMTHARRLAECIQEAQK